MYSGSGKTKAAAWKNAAENLDTLAVQLDRLAAEYKTHGLEIECFEKPIHALVERIGLIKSVEQQVIELAKARAMKLVARSLEIWEPQNGRFYAYIVKVCGGALAQKIYESRPPPYAVLILHVAKEGGGGHIYSERKRGSLCGTEKRFTQCETEIDFSGKEFGPWLEMNRLHVCQTCLRIYEKNSERILHDTVPRV